MLSKIIRTIERYRMVEPGERVLVGLSGGADSVALAEALVELEPRLRIALVLGHLNHGLRPEAEEDEEFCRSISERLSLPFVSARADVAAEARRNKRSIEDAARSARYQFLEAQAERFGVAKIAVGHTLDDQAETFLLRLLRGAGGRGLGGIHPVREGRIVRPLLDVRRQEIESYLEERGVSYREDGSNLDPRFTRNRIRHELLPLLSAAYNPRLADSLARCASLLREEEEWMEAETREAFDTLAAVSPGRVRLDRKALANRPLALRRRLVRFAIGRIRGLENVSHRHIEDVLSLAERGQSGRELHLPGIVVEVSFDEMRIRWAAPGGTGRGRKAGERGYNDFEYRLPIPARVRIAECRGTLCARIAEPKGDPDGPRLGNAVVVGFDGRAPGLPELKVRNPRPGDRFHPLGAPGSKPLSRYLMERKVSREMRSLVPLVVRSDSKGEILWVVGHGVSEASRVSTGSPRVSLRWVES
jgi:tRNA(Ile)-lysidine synthase